MTDKEKRKYILQIFYDKRKEGNLPINTSALTDKFDYDELNRLCLQLKDEKLIKGDEDSDEGGTRHLFESKITVKGTKFIENNSDSTPIPTPDYRTNATFNQTFNAPIHNLAQNSSNFSQNITNNIQPGDFESLKNYLQEIGIDDNDIERLKIALDEDDIPIEKQTLGKNTSLWFNEIKSKALYAAYNISYNLLPQFIFTGLDHYNGLM